MACIACAKARRRCGNQKPNCLRCRTRGISCQYPPQKPSSFVVLPGKTPNRTDSTPMISTSFPSLLTFPFGGTHQEAWWFASPETWSIDAPAQAVTGNGGRFTSLELKRILKHVVRWLAEWVENGSNPFIHARLYHHRLPRSIQDAYMSLSAYLNKTVSNESLLFRIIEDRITQLVTEGLPPRDASQGDSFDALEHLARVQALMIYQVIGLYDGNIRLRQLAQKHIPVLDSWLVYLAVKTSQSPDCGESLFKSHTPHSSQSATPLPPEDLPWYTYILIESVRRTWLVICGVQGIYKLMESVEASCLGGTAFTARFGFWEAKSAMAWEKKCCEKYAGLVKLSEIDKLFAMVPREEISDFAKVVLEASYGMDQLERWGVGVERGGELEPSRELIRL